MIQRYGAGNAALQKSCANGATPVTACPGNRRWIQLVFDSFPLMAVSQVSMVDSRDALLAADHAPLRRGEPGPAVERVRQAWPRRGRVQQRRRRRQPGAELRLAVRE